LPSASVLIAITAGMLAAMSAAWAYQRAVGNSGWIDVFWTFNSGIAGAVAALVPAAAAHGPNPRQWLVAALVAVWAIRLGGYIALRVARSEEDTRYQHFRRQWGARYQSTLYLFVLPQALITGLLCVSIQTAAQRANLDLGLRDALGAAILVIAIAGEALADRQLARFKAQNRKKGAICDAGLWRWSRHPNYFFEWFGWLAYAAIALDPAAPVTWLTLAAPAAMYLVLRYATGVKPLEETMIASRGDAYRAYQARTSAFIPLPPRSGAST
jgi:steroid 5-alpha reductase family enzyme